MKQAVEVFEEFIRQSSSTPNTRKHQPVEFGEVFIGNQSLPGLNLIEELKGKRIVRITGGVKQTYVFEESSGNTLLTQTSRTLLPLCTVERTTESK